MKIFYHSGDFDGIGSREVFKYFYPHLNEANFIGWDYGDDTFEIPEDDIVVVVDLNPEGVFGPRDEWPRNIVWIDHHKSAIDKLPDSIKGYRIDGVAACRLAWQWCRRESGDIQDDLVLPEKQDYVNRRVNEPALIRMLGEYDIWDKRDPNAEILQLGLKAGGEPNWFDLILNAGTVLADTLAAGRVISGYRKQGAEFTMRKSFLFDFEGLTFLCLNGRGNSLTFASCDVEDTGHDALMMFYYDGEVWTYSLYHAAHNTDIDLSEIAVKYGGGGHRGACGFQTAWCLVEF